MTLEILREYLAGADRAIEELSRADHLDTGSVRRTAHRLLGGARVLGLMRFERLWAALDGDAGTEPHVPSVMRRELGEARAELSARIDSYQRTQHV